jgi:glycosyltransferase involved in cell wall biosynthesis
LTRNACFLTTIFIKRHKRISIGDKLDNPELSIVLPCRNEEKGIGYCLDVINKVIASHNLDAEVIVSDSSSDRSPIIAKSKGAKVVSHGKKGYGIAYLEGFKQAKGKFIICADADGSYDYEQIPKFLHYLREGYDFVIGNRLKGKMEKGAMPWLHKYVGNPTLSFILRFWFRSKVRDSHCGIRGITRKALEKLELKTTGMEFASEMIIKVAKNKLKVKQFPTNYKKRIGQSKLKSFSDGWRHLRFMLMYAPDYLFVIPGLILLLLGIILMIVFISGPIQIFGLTLQSHFTILGSFLTILGYQIINTGLQAKAYSVSTGFEKKDKLVDLLAKLVTFESGVLIGGILFAASMLMGIFVFIDWVKSGFPGVVKVDLAVLILTLAIMGVQTMFSAFFLSIMLVEKNEN